MDSQDGERTLLRAPAACDGEVPTQMPTHPDALFYSTLATVHALLLTSELDRLPSIPTAGRQRFVSEASEHTLLRLLR
jgi:hypothetical protein